MAVRAAAGGRRSAVETSVDWDVQAETKHALRINPRRPDDICFMEFHILFGSAKA
jgi:hypothetical protein